MTVSCAVLGSPIEHSRSPLLHRAAYEVLGLDWEYGRFEVVEDELESFVAGLTGEWRGLSLTMPLKKAAFRVATSVDAEAQASGAINTLAFTPDGLRGYNTDIGGIVRACTGIGLTSVEVVHLIGAGATALSALVAARDLGATSVIVSARSAERAAALLTAAQGLGLDTSLATASDRSNPVDLVINTLPGGTHHDFGFGDATMSGATLLEVAYSPWPSPLVTAWEGAGGRVLGGLAMLLEQAVLQLRVFLNGSPDAPVPREAEVVDAMRRALGTDEFGIPRPHAS